MYPTSDPLPLTMIEELELERAIFWINLDEFLCRRVMNYEEIMNTIVDLRTTIRAITFKKCSTVQYP